jgi:hypothetical protein
MRQVSMSARRSRPRLRQTDRLRRQQEKDEWPKFNPRDYSPRELDVIETALRLMLRPKPVTAEPAVPKITEPSVED